MQEVIKYEPYQTRRKTSNYCTNFFDFHFIHLFNSSYKVSIPNLKRFPEEAGRCNFLPTHCYPFKNDEKTRMTAL